MVSPGTRFELGDHPLARAISAHHQSSKAVNALHELVALWKHEHPTYAELARSARRQAAALEKRAKILRARAEDADGVGELPL